MNKGKGTGSGLPSKQFIEVNNLLKTSVKCIAKQDCGCRNLKTHKYSSVIVPEKSYAVLTTSCQKKT